MKNSLRRNAFLLSYAILLLDITFRHIEAFGVIAHNALNFIALPILGLLIIYNLHKLPRKKAIMVIIAVTVSILTRIIANNNTIMLACMYICAFRDVKLNDVIKLSIILKIIFLLSLIALSSLGILNTATYMREDGVLRYTYGFSNINGLGAYIFSIVMQVLYLWKEKSVYKKLAITLAGIIVIMFLSASKTPMLILGFLSVLYFYEIMRRRDEVTFIKNKKAQAVTVHSFVLMALLSLLLYIGYTNGNSFAVSMNQLSSGRISSVQTLVNTNGIALFGKDIDRTSESSKDQRVLDSSYAYLLLYFGPIIVSSMAFLYSKGIRRIIKEKDYICASYIALYNVAGLMEHFAVEVSINPFILKMSDLIYCDDVESHKLCEGKKC